LTRFDPAQSSSFHHTRIATRIAPDGHLRRTQLTLIHFD
jgi:hypothetical protein